MIDKRFWNLFKIVILIGGLRAISYNVLRIREVAEGNLGEA